jgi:hypothetical protein
MDVTFAAVQMLRDLETIDRAEAAYLFASLIDHTLWGEMDEPDPGLEKAVKEDVEIELIFAAMTDQEMARTAAFHRDRGEEELAEMFVKETDAYNTLCAEGQISLIEDRPERDHVEPKDGAAAPALDLSERVLALSAAETPREWVPAWHAMIDVFRTVAPEAAVAAIQGLRTVGGISFNEALVLIDMAIDPILDGVLAYDREYRRLMRALEEFTRKHAINEGDGAPDAARPIGWQSLERRRYRRIEGLTAGILREFGEHKLANLIINDPEEYGRIRDDIGVGRIG